METHTFAPQRELDVVGHLSVPELGPSIFKVIYLYATGLKTTDEIKIASIRSLEDPSYPDATALIIHYVLEALLEAYAEVESIIISGTICSAHAILLKKLNEILASRSI